MFVCFTLIRAHPRQRWASAAAVPLTESLPYYEGAEPDSRKPPEAVKVHLTSHQSKRQVSQFFDQVTKLSNGVTVASLETHSFSSTLSVYVRAGSRFETYSQQGLSHLLKKAAFLVCVPVVCVCVCVCEGVHVPVFLFTRLNITVCWAVAKFSTRKLMGGPSYIMYNAALALCSHCM